MNSDKSVYCSMPRFIMKLHDDRDNKDYYLEWSTVVDAPVTYGMSLEEFKEHYQKRYGTGGMLGFDERIKCVEGTGISAHAPYDDFESYFRYNRAGENETCLNKRQILDQYCVEKVA